MINLVNVIATLLLSVYSPNDSLESNHESFLYNPYSKDKSAIKYITFNEGDTLRGYVGLKENGIDTAYVIIKAILRRDPNDSTGVGWYMDVLPDPNFSDEEKRELKVKTQKTVGTDKPIYFDPNLLFKD